MQVVLTVWNGRIAPVLDVARKALLLEVNGGSIIARREEPLSGPGLEQQAQGLMRLKPEALICGAVSRPLFDMLTDAGMRLFPFIAGNVEEVIAAYLAGKLPCPALSMPGCCGRRRFCQAAGPRRRRNRGGRRCRTTPILQGKG